MMCGIELQAGAIRFTVRRCRSAKLATLCVLLKPREPRNTLLRGGPKAEDAMKRAEDYQLRKQQKQVPTAAREACKTRRMRATSR